MRHVSHALLAGGLGLAAAFLTACGSSSGLLSASQANTLTSELQSASTAVANGNCISADNAIGTVQQQIANLPGSVDPTLVSDLSKGANTVAALAKKQCGTVGAAPHTTAVPAPTTTTTHAHTTSTSTPTTTTTSTTPTNTTSTPTTPTTPSTPATTPTAPGTSTVTGGGAGLPTGDGGGHGNGNGKGNGNGNGD